jgi:cysteine desulfurase
VTIVKLNPDFAVASQIFSEDIERIREDGFKALLCVRPDGETAEQPSFDAIAELASRVGLEARHLPIEIGKIGELELLAFARLVEMLPKPILGYCRTGNRAGILWSMSAGIRSADASA